jgi:hypothetical protein
MVEYAVLLAHNTFNILNLAANDVLAWVSGHWATIVIAALALISLRIGIYAFKGR